MYDPTAGRFISHDPKGLEGGDANLYRYSGNNPTNKIDPSGTVAVANLLALLAGKEEWKETPALARQPGMMFAVERAVRARVDKRLAPYAIKLAVEKGLASLRVNGVNVLVGDDLKARITKPGYEAINNSLGSKLVEATTKSGDKAWAAPLGGNWELKIYLKDGNYSVAVGHKTDSIEHYMDAIQWALKRNRERMGSLASITTYPNGDNAEEYLGNMVYDLGAAVQLKKYLDKGYLTKTQYDSVVKKGIFVGGVPDVSHATGAEVRQVNQTLKDLGIPGY
jgi:uncharacterized protein RhaS with RHS repeats